MMWLPLIPGILNIIKVYNPYIRFHASYVIIFQWLLTIISTALPEGLQFTHIPTRFFLSFCLLVHKVISKSVHFASKKCHFLIFKETFICKFLCFSSWLAYLDIDSLCLIFCSGILIVTVSKGNIKLILHKCRLFVPFASGWTCTPHVQWHHHAEGPCSLCPLLLSTSLGAHPVHSLGDKSLWLLSSG